jgi:LAO/AO transport system kinase
LRNRSFFSINIDSFKVKRFDMSKDYINKILDNDQLIISKTISSIEADTEIDPELFNEIHPYTTKAQRVGITGPPGAGKSTLIDGLIQNYLKNGKSVGVVAVDPTSPFTGGALLGDRVRMNQFAQNDNVFIRSMGSRGDLGGLAKKAEDVGDVLAASGKDVLIFETVGVGQGENDIVRAVDVTVVVLVPESGDEVQLMKAGLIEIGDIFVINKSDRQGANQLKQLLESVLRYKPGSENSAATIVSTIASRGEGIQELYNHISLEISNLEVSGLLHEKKMQRFKKRVLFIIQDLLLHEFWTSKRLDHLEKEVNNLTSSDLSAYEVASYLLKDLDNG